MSTRATITVADEHESFDLYQHHDGYPDGPHGLVRHIDMARRLAWDLPRFEAADFAAAIIAALKDRGGSTYLTKDAEAHDDRSFHYRIAPLQEETTTRVMLTITRPRWEDGKPDIDVFSGEIPEAIKQFDAVGEPSQGPREWHILGEIEAALFRAEEDIIQWTNEKKPILTTKPRSTISITQAGLCAAYVIISKNRIRGRYWKKPKPL